MPFGLQNAPATFQRLMMTILGDLNMKSVLIYLDDVIVFSQTFDEHLERLQTVCNRLKEHSLKLKPSKCHILRKEVSYLGHVVSAKGVATDHEKTAKVMEWPFPTSKKEVQQFLGFCGYYSRYVKSYSAIAAPCIGSLAETPGRRKGRKIPRPLPTNGLQSARKHSRSSSVGSPARQSLDTPNTVCHSSSRRTRQIWASELC